METSRSRVRGSLRRFTRGALVWTVFGSALCRGEVVSAQGRPASSGAQSVVRAAGGAGGEGLVVLITGSTDGLGREVARRLASGGAHVIVHGRNRERGRALVEEIEREGKGSASFYAADLSSLAAVRDLARAIVRDYDHLDVLVNNAGILLAGPEGRQLSADGHELAFQVNYLSGYLLTRLLLPLLERSAPSRIINVASAAQAPLDFGDVMLERRYSGQRGYAQSKLAQVMFTFDLARELEGTGVTVNALHPATLMDTHMVLAAGMDPQSTVAEGAEAVIYLVTARELGSGRYFDGKRPARAHPQAYDQDARGRLARLSRELTGWSRVLGTGFLGRVR